MSDTESRLLSSLTGVVLIDKPKGPTSHEVVKGVRIITGERRCGHTGTLDPFATGLLPVCVGRATRLARFISGGDKTYRALLRFGFATDTYDATGRPAGPVVDDEVELYHLKVVLASLVGEQTQVPPPFAAKKIHGQRMYRLARAGTPVQPRPVRVVVRRMELLCVEKNRAWLEVEVGSGTYIRSLAHELGQRLGLGAHVEELRRTRSEPFSVEQALTLEALEALGESGRLNAVILGPSDALCGLPSLHLGAEDAERIRHGRTVRAFESDEAPAEMGSRQHYRLLGPESVFLGVGVLDRDSQEVRPVVVLEGR